MTLLVARVIQSVSQRVCQSLGCYFMSHFEGEKKHAIPTYAGLSTVTSPWAFQFAYRAATENFPVHLLYHAEQMRRKLRRNNFVVIYA
jgi:hypothetical protein